LTAGVTAEAIIRAKRKIMITSRIKYRKIKKSTTKITRKIIPEEIFMVCFFVSTLPRTATSTIYADFVEVSMVSYFTFVDYLFILPR